MILWRPLFEGLAEGVRSSAKSSAGGVGCLLQRSSILAFRAILIRHGHLFTTSQWAAILSQTLIPSIQAGAESDGSPVLRITSESPSVSNIDFLVEPLPIPPVADDSSLLAFKKLQPNASRHMGDAELMLEASFCDLRHGGDGDPRNAYALSKKDTDTSSTEWDQPFPDSWIATTAPIALGLLTDIASEVAFGRDDEGRSCLWPLISAQYRRWLVSDEPSGRGGLWRPCEALVRIACREARRFPVRVSDRLGSLPRDLAGRWVSDFLSFFASAISDSAVLEKLTHRDLLKAKKKALIDRKGGESDSEFDDEVEIVETQYGMGEVKEKRKAKLRGSTGGGVDLRVTTNVIKLEFGGTLFQPVVHSPSTQGNAEIQPSVGIPTEVSGASFFDSARVNVQLHLGVLSPLCLLATHLAVPGAYWEVSIPELKRRCVAAHCLYQSLSTELYHVLLPYASRKNAFDLLNALSSSCSVAAAAASDEDLATAFQEALFSDWGDGVAAVEEALENAARLSHRHGSGMFFLTQQAGATNAMLRMLSTLYLDRGDRQGDWDRATFSEPHLLGLVNDVTTKFLQSERQDGHLIDPHVWRNANESGGKVALYCTSFAFVVLEIVRVVRAFPHEQFVRHKQLLFPVLCSLIAAQSDEIRHLVQETLVLQVSPIIDVTVG
jgi:hypothetical protein